MKQDTKELRLQAKASSSWTLQVGVARGVIEDKENIHTVNGVGVDSKTSEAACVLLPGNFI